MAIVATFDMISVTQGDLGLVLVIMIDGDAGETYPFQSYFRNDLYLLHGVHTWTNYVYDGETYGGCLYRGLPDWPIETQMPVVVDFLTQQLGWVVRNEVWSEAYSF